MFYEKIQHINNGEIRTILNSRAVEFPTPAEIVEAKEDGICPRCERKVDIDANGGLCHFCGLSW